MSIDTAIRIALATISFGCALLALFSDQVRKPIGYWLFFLLMVGFALTLLETYLDYQESLKSARSGKLKAQQEYTLFPSNFPTYSKENVQIRVGNSETYYVLDSKNWLGKDGPGSAFDPRPLFEPMYGGDQYKVYFWLEDDQPRMRINIYNPRLQLVAEIDENRWVVNRNFLYDLNYDSEAIEIRDDEGNIQLQVIFYKTLVQLSFINYSPAGGVAMVGYEGQGANEESFPLNERSSHRIKPLFKYPSVEFQGVRVEDRKRSAPELK